MTQPCQKLVYVILGSGGHTAEMCKINLALFACKSKYTPMRYILADSDTTSRKKILGALSEAGHPTLDNEDTFIKTPRSREVGQRWVTTLFTTIWALLFSFWLVWRDRPKLILCNGPGTCVPFCYAAFLCRWLGRLTANSKIVFVESYCRVHTLSLSGRLLLPLVDMFVVQWPALAERYKDRNNVRYFGSIM